MTYKILYITANNNNPANVSSCYTFSHCLTNVIPSHPLISRTAFPDLTYMPYKTFKNTLNFSSKIIIFAF